MYHIPDEPVPSRWNHLVVDPLWPLLAVMFAGSWLAFPWFAFNGFVMGAHNRYKTLFLSSVALAGNITVILLIAFLVKLLGLARRDQALLERSLHPVEAGHGLHLVCHAKLFF